MLYIYELPAREIVEGQFKEGRTKYTYDYLVSTLEEIRVLYRRYDELGLYTDVPVVEFHQRAGDLYPVNNWLKVIKALKKAIAGK